ncbi:MAG: exo-alpha-sialidase [Chitinophagaceae bacterium]|nr:exo-alpha-sialidase [Chitinophagaceae bacterium]
MKIITSALVLLISLHSMAQSGPRYDKVPGIPVVHSPKSTGIYVGTPTIAIMSNGDYILGHDLYGDPIKPRRLVHIYYSKDKGQTWQFQAEVDSIHWAGLFVIRDTVYLLGREGKSHSMAISRSTDRGKTWTSLSILKKRQKHGYHGSSTPVVFHNGRVYKGYDHHVPDKNDRWMSDNYSFIMSASTDANLLDSLSWTFSTEAMKPYSIEGTGWLETNAVLGRDGLIKGITRIASEQGFHAGYYSLSDDATIDTSTIGKIDFIGGATKFNIMWDPKTKKYWALVNYPSLVVRKLKKRAGGMRSILALTSSKDLKKWKVESIVLATEDVHFHGFQYVDWQFDGNDIVFASRTAYDDGLGGAFNYHDANYITFHRISNYKKAKVPKIFKYLLEE